MPNTKTSALENPEQSQKKENTILRELTSASIILALVTSLLYISGATYINAYLSEWGVVSSLITSNTQELLVHGVTVLYVGGIYAISLGIIIGLAFFLQVYTVSEASKFHFIRKISSKIYKVLKLKETDELDPPLILQSTIKLILQILVFLSLLSILWIIFYQLLALSTSLGEERAKNEYIEFSTGKVTNEKIFTRKKFLNINGEEKEGYILANSNSLVALYLPASEGQGEQVVIVPLSSVSNIKALKNHNITIETIK